MRKLEEMLSGPAGCLGSALDEEMLFVLLARDRCAPEAVRYWAYLRAGGRPLQFYLPALPESAADKQKVEDALHCADLMATERNDIRAMLGKEPTEPLC